MQVEDKHTMPRWVKRSIGIAAFLVVALVLLMVFGGGAHGPWRHFQPAQTQH